MSAKFQNRAKTGECVMTEGEVTIVAAKLDIKETTVKTVIIHL